MQNTEVMFVNLHVFVFASIWQFPIKFSIWGLVVKVVSEI